MLLSPEFTKSKRRTHGYQILEEPSKTKVRSRDTTKSSRAVHKPRLEKYHITNNSHFLFHKLAMQLEIEGLHKRNMCSHYLSPTVCNWLIQQTLEKWGNVRLLRKAHELCELRIANCESFRKYKQTGSRKGENSLNGEIDPDFWNKTMLGWVQFGFFKC